MRLGIGLVLGSAVLLVRSQSTYTISVGQFYEPPLISALEGDVVQFLFTAGHHGVTQSSGVADPCSQLPGGFSSGIIGGFVANDTNPSPIWSLTITNTSAPIFFYCAATLPSFHCANGMVGAVNAEPDVYTSYSLAAKSVTGTPVQTSSVVLSGVGAVATAPPFTPTPSVLPTTSATTSSDIALSTSASSSSALPSETSALPDKSSSNEGAAIGGGIAGAVAVCVIALLSFFLFRARRQRIANASATFAPETGEKYNPSREPMTPPGLGLINSYQGDPFLGLTPGSALQHNHTVSSRMRANTDVGSLAGGVNYGRQRAINEYNDNPQSRATLYTQDSIPSGPALSGGLPGQEFGSRTADSVNTTFQPQPKYPPGIPSHNMNVHELAKEVATLLGPQLRNANTPPPASPPPTHHRALPIPHSKPIHDDRPPRSSAPPQYDSYDDRH